MSTLSALIQLLTIAGLIAGAVGFVIKSILIIERQTRLIATNAEEISELTRRQTALGCKVRSIEGYLARSGYVVRDTPEGMDF